MAQIDRFISPGVYLQEKQPAQPQASLSESALGICGFTIKGPENTPTRVTSYEEFRRQFGDLSQNSLVPISLEAYFGNGGQVAWVSRVAPSDALASTISIDTTKWTLDAASKGVWGNSVVVRISGNENFLVTTAGSEGYTKYDALVLEPDDFGVLVASEVFEAVQFTDSTAPDYFPRVLNDRLSGSGLIVVTTGTGGDPTALVAVNVDNFSTFAPAIDGVVKAFTATLVSLPVMENKLTIRASAAAIVAESVGTGDGTTTAFTGTAASPQVVPGTVSITDGTQTVTDDGAGNLIGAIGAGTNTIDYTTGAYAVDFVAAPANLAAITIDYHNALVVTDNGLGALVGNVDPTGTNTVVYSSGAIDVTFSAAPISGGSIIASYVKLTKSVDYSLAAGSDGSGVIARADVSAPALEAAKKGIYAFDKVEDGLTIALPDFGGNATVAKDQIDFAEARDDRYIILNAANAQSVDQAVQYKRNSIARDTKEASMYFPNILYQNRQTEAVEEIPNLGIVAGIYARTDRNVNPGKAPAGTVDGRIDHPNAVAPALDLGLDRAAQDKLAAAGINAIISTRATGFIVNSGLSMSTEKIWKYTQARRLYKFIGKLAFLDTQFAVNENNGPALRSKALLVVKGRLSSLFKSGHFAGNSEKEAFFVVVDETNNTKRTLDEGKLIIDIGIAPNKPAQFVINRIQQKVI